MITREFTHTFKVDFSVTREGSEFVVTADNIDGDGGDFHYPVSGPTECARVDIADVVDDPIVGHEIHSTADGPVDKVTEAAIIRYVFGDDDD